MEQLKQTLLNFELRILNFELVTSDTNFAPCQSEEFLWS